MSVAAPYVLLNGVSSYCKWLHHASVVFGWIVATLLHHTRDRKVERKFLDASGVPTLKWKRGEWNSGSIICRPPLLELPAFGTLNTPAHLVCLMKKCMPAEYSGT